MSYDSEKVDFHFGDKPCVIHTVLTVIRNIYIYATLAGGGLTRTEWWPTLNGHANLTFSEFVAERETIIHETINGKTHERDNEMNISKERKRTNRDNIVSACFCSTISICNIYIYNKYIDIHVVYKSIS